MVDRLPDCATSTAKLPAAAMSEAGIEAVNCVALTNVVVLADPTQATVAPETNPLPFTVSVKALPPATAVDGASEVRDGRAETGGALIVNDTVPDRSPLSVFTTATGAVPAAVRKLAGMAAVSCVALTSVVAAIRVPFHSIWAPVR